MYRSTLTLSALAGIATAQSTVYVTPVPSASATAVAATAAGLTCPDANNTVYTAPSGDQFVVECDIDHNAGDLEYVQVDSFEECILACDETEDCVDVSLSGVACYLKSSLGTSEVANGIWGARLIVSATGVSAPPPTYSAVSASCPANNGSTFVSSSYARYVIECGFEHAAGDMAMKYVDDLTECIELCDETDGCVDVSLSGSACYLKSSVGAITFTDGISSARLVAVGPQCPLPVGSNGTYTAENGLVFEIECDVDHPGGDSDSVILGDSNGTPWFGECIELCADDPTCVDISLSGAACYLKDTLNPSSTATGIYGARLLTTRPASNTTTPSPTATPTPHAISPVDVGDYEYLACYNDSVTRRVLNSGFLYGTNVNNMTAQKCAEYCDDYNYFGLEYGQECYCGGTLLNNPVETPKACNIVCAGNTTQLCGGDNALSLYRKAGSPAPNVSSSSSVAAVSSSTSTSEAAVSSTSSIEASSTSSMPTLTGTSTFPTSTGSVNGTNGNGTISNSTARLRRRGPRLGPVRLDLNYEV